jgi:acetyl/propionyl-CoA carboxylase alpha subunit
MITSIFTIAGDFLKSWHSAYEQRCAIAQQVVLDESPSPALSPAQRSRLNDRALHKVDLCMGESG